jgi:hypothetical protein
VALMGALVGMMAMFVRWDHYKDLAVDTLSYPSLQS